MFTSLLFLSYALETLGSFYSLKITSTKISLPPVHNIMFSRPSQVCLDVYQTVFYKGIFFLLNCYFCLSIHLYIGRTRHTHTHIRLHERYILMTKGLSPQNAKPAYSHNFILLMYIFFPLCICVCVTYRLQSPIYCVTCTSTT